MNEVLSFDNFLLRMPGVSSYSSDSLIEESDKITEHLISDKFAILRNNIGEVLFNKLSYDQKKFIVDVSGTIDLGRQVDIDAIYKNIEELDYD